VQATIGFRFAMSLHLRVRVMSGRKKSSIGAAMGTMVSELLADALARRRPSGGRLSFRWTSRQMNPLVDLADKETVYARLDSGGP
jgi:hypothetical protein